MTGTDENDRSPRGRTLSWEQAVEFVRASPRHRELVEDAYYDDPLVDAAERYFRSAEWAAVRELLGEPCGRALDVGAGRGIASYALARSGFEVTALEPDPSALVGAAAIESLVAESGANIRVVREVSERLPFADRSFDLVFARAVLHHTSDLHTACREFRRVLRPGGRLLAIREHVVSRREDLPAFLASHPMHALYGGENAFLLREYVSALSSAGFRVDRVIRPLESPINYAPHTAETLRAEFASRLAPVPGLEPVASALLAMPIAFRAAIAMAGLVDSRPGRLYSFYCIRTD